MELKEIFEFFSREKIKLLSILLVGGIFGVVLSFLLPDRYIAKGTFYISRIPEEKKEEYTYSGYYGQQTAIMYSKTIRGVLEDTSFQARVLEQLEIPFTDKGLRKLKNRLRVKDVGPQLVAVEIKDSSHETALEIWETVAENLRNVSSEINKNGDSNLYLKKLNETPVVQKSYINVYVFGLVGALLAFGSGTSFLALKNYLKEEKNG